MKKKLRLRSNSIYKEEILQLIDDVIPMVEEFYRKRDITVTAILYDYATDIVSFEFDAPKGYYPKFSFYRVCRKTSHFRARMDRQFRSKDAK